MRLTELFEADQPLRQIVATPRFFKEYPKFVKKYKSFRSNLRDFLLFRQDARVDQPYNSKDATLTGSIWRGQGLNLRRVHLIHGKALVIYNIAAHEIRLVIIGEHDDIEGSSINRLVTYAKTLSPEDFSKFPIPAENVAAPALDQQQTNELGSLIRSLINNPKDRYVIAKVAKGDIEDFMDWARLTLDFTDDSKDVAIINAFGGKEKLMKQAASWLTKSSERIAA